MNLNSLDLNLLVALDALLGETNVSRAAMRIGLSQPAASHALQRLRDLIGDPLLVRNGARMELTPRAQALRAPLAQALDQVRSLFSRRRFRRRKQRAPVSPDDADLGGRALDAAADGDGSPKWRRTSGSSVVPWRGPAIFTAEFARTIDMVISIGNAFTGFHRQRLYTDSDALAVRRGHPVGATAEADRNLSRRAACRGRDPRPERGPDRHAGCAPRASSGGSRWSCPAISRRCTSPRAPISSPSCRAG